MLAFVSNARWLNGIAGLAQVRTAVRFAAVQVRSAPAVVLFNIVRHAMYQPVEIDMCLELFIHCASNLVHVGGYC